MVLLSGVLPVRPSLPLLLILQKTFVRLSTYNDTLPVIPGPLTHNPPLFQKLNLLNIFDISYISYNLESLFMTS